MTVYKKDFIKQLMDKYHYTKTSATSVVDDFWSVLLENIEEGNSVCFHGYGNFDIIERAGRLGVNPQTGERIPVPAHYVPRFYPGNSLKRAVKMWVDNKEKGLM